MDNILEMLRGRDPEEDLFMGDIIVRAKPIRRRNSKYYVPEFLYGGGLYPDYAGGGGFVMSGHTARRLGSACRQVTPLEPYSSRWSSLTLNPPLGGAVPHR